MKHQIKHRYTDAVLFECEVPDDLQALGLAMRHALEQAVKSRANLSGAYLSDANLSGAKIADKLLIGDRPVFVIGLIGSRCDYFTSYLTDSGVMLRAGCFFGTMDEFSEKLTQEHGLNDHAREYTAALALIECHAEIWTPKDKQ